MNKSGHLDYIKRNYTIDHMKNIISKFKNIKTLVIGDAIIDEYHFTTLKGRAIKDPILSVDYVRHEVYLGGILAIANHISNFVGEVACVTALGDREDKREVIETGINKNVKLKLFVKEDSPTTVKKRYLNILRNEKLFKVENINDAPIPETLEHELVEYLKNELPNYDLVLVGDFGHGLITESIIRVLEEKSNYLAVNAQCNSANLGFNYVTKYRSLNYATMDIQELMYAVSDRFSNVKVLMKNLADKTGFNKFLVTMGKDGSDYFNNGLQTFAPAFITRPQDTVGAGDAVFSITSLFAYCDNDEIIPFIANCVGGIAVSYMGNREYITKEGLLNFIEEVYNGNTEVHGIQIKMHHA